MTIYDINVLKGNGDSVNLAEYKWKVMLIVNTASQCGFTPQYDGLEKLYETYSHDDFVVLGFPCNQFGGQEPGTDTEIAEFCKLNHGVTFPLFAKIDVNGENEHPLYTFLKSQKSGWITDGIKWNFTKFLIDQEGNVIERYAPTVSPSDIAPDIEKLISDKK